MLSAALVGIDAYLVEVEVDLAGGLPGYQIVGLAAMATVEGKVRIRAALENSGLSIPPRKVSVNLAPADVRKDGAAFFFPGLFSTRAGAYAAKVGAERARAGMARWYRNAVTHARLNPDAQEFHNTVPDLLAQGLTPPNPKAFTEHLNLFDCSKVSDGAASLLVTSEAGYLRLGLTRRDVVEVVGLAQVTANLTLPPPDLTELTTSRRAAAQALAMAGIGPREAGVFEVHDCFTISGLLSVEALGLAPAGGGADLVLSGATERSGEFPMNTGGGLVGYGHPTGATGVRMAVDLWKQLTGRAGGYQVDLAREHGIMVSMGGNDKTVVALVVRR